MTDAQLLAMLDSWVDQGIVCLLASDLAPIRDRMVDLIVAKNSMKNLVLSADTEDNEQIAWAIQIVRDDLAGIENE